MQEETGEIRDYKKVPKEELGKWSEPFSVGEIIDFKGIRMELIRIKKARKEIHLKKDELRKWSEPFYVGDIVDFKGIKMEIIRIKKAREEIHLKHHAP